MSNLITFCFITLDFITGMIKAIKEKNFNSSKMREGLINKIGSIMIIILGYLIDYTQNFVDLGFTIPVSNAIDTYIILMEIGSIVENVGKINPNILPDKVKEIFEKLKE